MTIIYSCIARGTTILCSHGVQHGSENYEKAADAVLPSIPTRNDGKTTITATSCKFHCIVENGLIFVCAAKPEFATRQCFAFLTDIKDTFRNGNYTTQAVTAGSHQLDSEFNRVLAKQMDKFSKPGAGSNIDVLQGQVKEITGVMSKNIEAVIERGERLDDLMDKTDELEAASATFAKTASKIKRKYWWRNTKMKLVIVCVVLVILTGIVLAIVLNLPHGSSDDSGNSATTPAPTPKT